ncbi:MAG: exosortase O [Pegethrix bostrychoides GSE-TBD4-15B]|uniref:Exosortase O n=1 Tax=Pegethrix bostrychoides GSE-TBD4-15B TaxID=2839662 RepID=A0A951PAX2_9CYAN|nr:exosortase O [Pegethrix bostrychoides GSE-TBD4-15B]
MTHDLAQPPQVGVKLRATERLTLLLVGLLVLSWLWLNASTLTWFGESLLGLPRFNQLFLAAVALLLGWLAVRRPLPVLAAQLRLFPLVLLLGSALLALGSRWLLAFEQIPGLLFLLGSYGLAGLFLHPATWRRGLPVAATVAAVVPFWLQFTTGLGFPARILTAQAVEAILNTWQITALSSADIIVLDTGIAQVDLPCSGLKSLWMGTVLLLAMTGLEGRKLGWRWLLVCCANWGLLVSANVMRVLSLVLLTNVLRQPALADLLHMPLGLVSFVTVSLLAWGLLRWVPQAEKARAPVQAIARPAQPASPKLLAGLIAVLLLLSFLPRPAAVLPVQPALAHLSWPAAMQVEPMALSQPEQAFFVSYDGVTAEKQRFDFEGIAGSMILVASPTWQAHHSPELCYISSGFEINQMRQQQLTDAVLGRWLSLKQDATQQAAAYWFQSPHRTTDSYLDRLWAELSRQEPAWTMVSVLFDQPYSPESPQVQAFLNQVQSVLAAQ